MKKKTYLLLPIALLLTSCGEITIGFSQGDTHSAGFDRPVSSQDTAKPSYSYINNTSLDNAGLNAATLTFANIEQSDSDIQNLEKIQSFLVFDQNIFTDVANPHYFGVKNDEQIVYLGADSTYVDGEITFNFNTAIKNVEITAKQYFYVETAFNEDKLMVDEEVAISVNDGGFIRLDGEKDEENHTVNPVVLGYHLATESQTIKIKVGKRRAIIEKIVFYY